MNINIAIEKVYESVESLRDKAKDLRIYAELTRDLLNGKLKKLHNIKSTQY